MKRMDIKLGADYSKPDYTPLVFTAENKKSSAFIDGEWVIISLLIIALLLIAYLASQNAEENDREFIAKCLDAGNEKNFCEFELLKADKSNNSNYVPVVIPIR